MTGIQKMPSYSDALALLQGGGRNPPRSKSVPRNFHSVVNQKRRAMRKLSEFSQANSMPMLPPEEDPDPDTGLSAAPPRPSVGHARSNPFPVNSGYTQIPKRGSSTRDLLRGLRDRETPAMKSFGTETAKKKSKKRKKKRSRSASSPR